MIATLRKTPTTPTPTTPAACDLCLTVEGERKHIRSVVQYADGTEHPWVQCLDCNRNRIVKFVYRWCWAEGLHIDADSAKLWALDRHDQSLRSLERVAEANAARAFLGRIGHQLAA